MNVARNIRWGRWPLALLVALISLSFGWGSALAAPGDAGSKALERGYTQAKKALMVQDQHLKRLGEYADKVAAAIAKVKAKGKDTTSIEQALATFRDKLTAARASWQTASTALAGHDGFDAQGKVMNADTARATLKTAKDAMVQVHQTVEGSAKALRDALKAFRQANRESKTPDMPPAPPTPTP
jgi:hypothetical protein